MREFDNLPFPMGFSNTTTTNSNNSSTNNSSVNVTANLGFVNSSPSMNHLLQGNHHTTMQPNSGVSGSSPPLTSSSSSSGAGCGATRNAPSDAAWRENGGEELRRLRSRCIVLIERMLRNHQPHDVLTQVPENYDWRSKTFLLAIKIEKLMFLAATSRENYLNEHTLRSRVQLLSRHLVRIRKRKNAMATAPASAAV